MGKIAKKQSEGVRTLLQTAFSAILPTGLYWLLVLKPQPEGKQTLIIEITQKYTVCI